MPDKSSTPAQRALVYFGLKQSPPGSRAPEPPTPTEAATSVVTTAVLAGIIVGLISWNVSDGVEFAVIFAILMGIYTAVRHRRTG